MICFESESVKEGGSAVEQVMRRVQALEEQLARGKVGPWRMGLMAGDGQAEDGEEFRESMRVRCTAEMSCGGGGDIEGDLPCSRSMRSVQCQGIVT